MTSPKDPGMDRAPGKPLPWEPEFLDLLRASVAKALEGIPCEAEWTDARWIATLDASLAREAALRSEVKELRGLLGEIHKFDRRHSTLTMLPRELSDKIDKALGKGE